MPVKYRAYTLDVGWWSGVQISGWYFLWLLQTAIQVGAKSILHYFPQSSQSGSNKGEDWSRSCLGWRICIGVSRLHIFLEVSVGNLLRLIFNDVTDNFLNDYYTKEEFLWISEFQVILRSGKVASVIMDWNPWTVSSMKLTCITLQVW